MSKHRNRKHMTQMPQQQADVHQLATKAICDILRKLSYDFLDTRGRRRNRGSVIKTQTEQLDENKRKTAINTARSLYQNVDEFAWAVNFHVTATTGYVFKPCTGDSAADAALQAFYDEFNGTADITRRRTFEELVRMWELRALLDGDVLKVYLENGQIETLQAEWIQNPDGTGDDNWIDGVLVGEYGQPLSYSIRRTTTRGKEICRIIPAENAKLKYYSEGIVDAYRGVSPLTSAFSDFQDLLEAKVYTNTKVKMEAIMALAIKRNVGRTTLEGFQSEWGQPLDDSAEQPLEQAASDAACQLRREIDMEDGGGAKILDLLDDEEVTPITNQTPNATFMSYYKLILAAAFKAFRLPMSFYDESLSNYNSMRCANMLYLDNITNIIERNMTEAADDILWALRKAWAAGRVRLPAGMVPSRRLYKLIHKRRRIIDADREIKAAVMGIGAGLFAAEDVAAEYGIDLKEVIGKNAELREFAERLEMPLGCFEKSYGITTENASE